ncbi:uncharacterized protein PpBr36_11147 [Pyricularia pennisetigena]|uniref:uncharacterized protein n=1 Tax=Pyricularia pennisetigena TaxID=1578925 RepID=UPI00114F7321|nr:uncharacterized protein PpBr36_11147 [Pyricularia pennisetigena]TLS20513.1 hypothetical protein PpBr36_11147 [Pyricularia pennisetigena]
MSSKPEEPFAETSTNAVGETQNSIEEPTSSKQIKPLETTNTSTRFQRPRSPKTPEPFDWSPTHNEQVEA